MEENNNVENVENAQNIDTQTKSDKNWLTALILCWFLGFLGVHRLYAGKLGTGFLMAYLTIVAGCILAMNLVLGLVAFVVVGGLVVNDFLRIATKTFTDCKGAYIESDNI